MKYLLAILAIVAFFVGCDYLVPLTDKHTISVDEAVLGLWEEIPANEEEATPQNRMLILKYTNTEYLIFYPMKGDDFVDGMFFRGYAMNIDGVPCVQVQLIGTTKGVIDEEDRKYQVISYKRDQDKLAVRVLNTDLVDPELTDSAELRKAFLEHKDNAELFRDPGMFRRVAKDN